MKNYFSFRNVKIFSIILIFILIKQIANAQVCGVNAGTSRTICISDPLTLSGTIGSLEATTTERLWTQMSGPATIVVNPTSLRTTIQNISPGNYVYQFSGKCVDGLIAKDLVYITVLPEPATPIVGSDSVVCFNTSIQLNGNEVNFPNVGTWTVSPNVGSFYPNANTANAIYTDSTKTPGIKKFVWTVSNGNCSKSATKQITFSEPTLPVYAGADTTLFCKGKCMNLNGSFPGSGSLQSGLWTLITGPNSPAFSNATKRNSKICNLIPGIYILRWTVSGTCVNDFSDIKITVLNINEPPATIGDRIYSEYCETPIVTSQLLQGAPRAHGDSVIWEQISGGSDVTFSPNRNESRVTAGNLTGRFPYKFNYTQISEQGCSITKVHTVYRAQPILGLTQPTDLILPCNVTDTVIEITFDRSTIITGTISRRAIFISGPIDTAKVSKEKSIITSSSTIDVWRIKDLEVPGDYIYKFEYENACGVLYRDIKITVSKTPGALNPGSDLHLPCRELAVSPIGSVQSPGQFVWSQVSGPTVATIIGENLLSPVIENLSHGVYKFRLSNNAGPACLSRSKDMSIIVTQAPPLVASTGADASICAGSYRLSGNFPSATESGEWFVTPSEGLEFLPNKNTANAVVSGLNPNSTYYFTWKIKNACGSVSASQTLTTGSFYSAPVADAGDDICLPSGTSGFILTGNNADNSSSVWIALTEGAELANPNSAVSEAHFASSGIYMFEYSLGSAGCDAIKDTIVVSVKSNSSINVGDDIKICTENDNERVLLNAALSGESFPGKWNMISGPSIPNIISVDSLKTEVTDLIEGNYLFEYSIYKGNSCLFIADTVLVIISKRPSVARAGEDLSICNATPSTRVTIPGSFPATGIGSWSVVNSPSGNGNSVFSNLGSQVVTISNLFQGVYRLRYTVSNGEVCESSTDEMVLNVNVKADAGDDKSECGTSIISLTGNANTEGVWSILSNYESVTITPSSGNTSIVTGIIPDLETSYSFRYSLPEQGDCPATFSDVVYNIFPNPSRAVTQGNISLCSNVSTVTLSGNIPETGIGKWYLVSGPNTPSAGVSNNSSNDTLLNNIVPGIYEYSYEISTNPSCSTSKESILIMKEITAKTRADFRVCESSVLNLSANVPLLGVGSWTYVSGTSQPDSVIFSDVNNPFSTVSGLNYGPHLFRWQIPGLTNCNSTSNDLTIYRDSSISELSAGDDTSFCQNENNLVTLGKEEITGVYYTWYPETFLDNVNVAKPQFSGNNYSGYYTYTLKGRRGACESYSSIHLNVLPKPFANININYGSCQAQFSASAPGRGINNPDYMWNLGGDTLATIGSGPFQIDFNSTNPQILFLRVVSQDGCISVDTLNFSPYCIVPLKIISFNGNYEKGISKLNWAVENSESYKEFEVQRSFTGNNFYSIGLVRSSSEIKNYKLDDNDSELKYNKSIYYRLKAINFNNEASYSDIILLKNGAVTNIKISPNPFVDRLSIKLNPFEFKETVVVKIHSTEGGTVFSRSVTMERGQSEILINDLVNLSSGTYFIRIMNSRETFTQKIIKIF